MNLKDEKIPHILKIIKKKKDSKTLVLNNNDFTSKGFKMLLDNMINLNIEKIYLKNNKIDKQAFKFIEKHCNELSNIKYINLEGNSIKNGSDIQKSIKTIKSKGIMIILWIINLALLFSNLNKIRFNA